VPPWPLFTTWIDDPALPWNSDTLAPSRPMSAAVCLLSIPATTPVPCNARDDQGCYKHYGDSRCHDASICDTPHVRHSKVYSSDNPPKRGVRRTSFMG
jgi:hypothetical protein